MLNQPWNLLHVSTLFLATDFALLATDLDLLATDLDLLSTRIDRKLIILHLKKSNNTNSARIMSHAESTYYLLLRSNNFFISFVSHISDFILKLFVKMQWKPCFISIIENLNDNKIIHNFCLNNVTNSN